LRGLFQPSQFKRRRRGDKPETLAALTSVHEGLT
jgi:hypothetical protein